MGNNVKYIYDQRGRVIKEYKDIDILESLNEDIDIIADKFAKMVVQDGYDKTQLEDFILQNMRDELATTAQLELEV